MRLATWYALGHALMILVLGLAAIVFADRLPRSFDAVMERVVGLTLIGLGLYIGWTLLTRRGAMPIRSRWMLLLAAGSRLSQVTMRVCDRRAVRARRLSDEGAPVVIEHTHGHDHRHSLHAHEHAGNEHAHVEALLGGLPDQLVAPGSVTGSVPTTVVHRHPHRHVARMPSDPFVSYGTGSAMGIGVLHGIGAETPTQILVFTAAVDAQGTVASVGLLVMFIVGLVTANTLVAAASTYGFLRLATRRWLVTVLSVVTALFSLLLGTSLVL